MEVFKDMSNIWMHTRCLGRAEQVKNNKEIATIIASYPRWWHANEKSDEAIRPTAQK